MAFRRSENNNQGSSPSLGYRLSSDRQPGIATANTGMPLTAPRDMKGPRPFPRQGIEQLPEYFKPIGRPGMGNYQNMGGQSSSDRRDRYIANTQGGHPSMSQYGYPMQVGVGPFDDIFHSEQSAVDPSDWRTLETILGAGGNPDDYVQMAEMGGYGYNPDPNKTYDDLYGGQDIIDMEILPGAGYGPSDEHEFDRKKGFENRIWGIEPQYSARGGIASLRRQYGIFK